MSSMVKEESGLFACGECGMKFKEKDLAKKCEDWCKKTHSCNIDIIQHAVKD